MITPPSATIDAGAAGSDLWQVTLDALPDSLVVLDHVGDIVAVNQAWKDFSEANGGDDGRLGSSYLRACDEAAPDPIAAGVGSALREVLAGLRPSYECTYPCHTPTRERWFSMRATALQGTAAGMVAVTHQEVTARHRAELRVDEQAALLVTMAQAMRDGLLVIDAGGRVTLVNDAAVRLLGWARNELLGEIVDDKLHALDRDGVPRPVADRPIVPAHDGGAQARVDDDVFQCCDGSLMPVAYSAAPFVSDSGERSWVVVFHDITERLAREVSDREESESLSWVGQIHEALEDGRIVLYAQAIIDVWSGEAVQHELLVRMIGRDGEVIAPGAFLPAAERYGLIGAIDRRVFELAMAYAAAGNRIEVNISADSISDPGLFVFVQEQILAHNVDPRLIVFEITETALIQNEAVAQEFIANVRSLNCEVALDDFGTGYGGFYYLKHLPISVLKIDREFVGDLDGEGSGASRQVVKAVVALARGLGQRTVAEGVESLSTLGLLRELGVDYAQGYLFARPAPAEGVMTSVGRKA